MEICVFGAGAIGSYVAAQLSSAGKDVCVVARGPHLEAIQPHDLKLIAASRDDCPQPHKRSAVELGPQDFATCALNAHQVYESAPVELPKAPVQVIYVVDLHHLTHTVEIDEPGLHDPEIQKSYYFVDTGIIAGNVYLFAAVPGLASWFHNCEKQALARSLAPRPGAESAVAQSVGWPTRAETMR